MQEQNQTTNKLTNNSNRNRYQDLFLYQSTNHTQTHKTKYHRELELATIIKNAYTFCGRKNTAVFEYQRFLVWILFGVYLCSGMRHLTTKSQIAVEVHTKSLSSKWGRHFFMVLLYCIYWYTVLQICKAYFERTKWGSSRCGSAVGAQVERPKLIQYFDWVSFPRSKWWCVVDGIVASFSIFLSILFVFVLKLCLCLCCYWYCASQV